MTTVTETPVVAARHSWTDEEKESLRTALEGAERGQKQEILESFATKFGIKPESVRAVYYQDKYRREGRNPVGRNPIERLVNERESLVTKAAAARDKATAVTEAAKEKASVLREAAKVADVRVKAIDGELKAFQSQISELVG